MKIFYLFTGIIMVLISCQAPVTRQEGPVNISGIYPHLAHYNNENECGTGALVPWADRLWVISYGPHLPFGSSDKLYEITRDLERIVREESIGGTPANRMIHKESQQLFIGPYAIDSLRNVRVITYEEMPGRPTGNARHLSDPGGKIYYGTMEEGFYEVDVHTLEVNTLYVDGNLQRREGDMHQFGPLLPGAHGKGLYSGQGVMVYSNNGEDTREALKKFDIEAGSLTEWDGKDWKLVRRNQFVEVTGPGGIYGNANPETDPIWATGWDHKSILIGVRSDGSWSFYRLPKASHSYDGAHGWNTEWPRIRDIGTHENPDYLMTMHGLFWRFPGTFTRGSTAGIRPRSAYLKVIGDFTRWNDRLVFGCDDATKSGFLNERKISGGIARPGQSNSNLWFTAVDIPDKLGPSTAEGAVWLDERVQADVPSEAFLFAGWPRRMAWLHNSGGQTVNFSFELDRDGTGEWEILQHETVAAGSAKGVEFTKETEGEWIRVSADLATRATVQFSYSAIDERSTEADEMFACLSTVEETKSKAGLLYLLGDDRRALGVAVVNFDGSNEEETGYYELDADLQLISKVDPETEAFIREKMAIPEHVVTVEESSVLIVDEAGRRWRLPLGNGRFTDLTNAGSIRLCREVVTERDLLNCHGTIYELPAENADGFAKIRPVASHNLRIHDYASYRGLLIMTGLKPEAGIKDPLVIQSEDGKAAVWAGVIDVLWNLGSRLSAATTPKPSMDEHGGGGKYSV